jgi:hypothetical protein
MRSFIPASLLVALALLFASLSSALAAPPFVEQVNGAFDDVLCGIPVHNTVVGTNTGKIKEVVIDPGDPTQHDGYAYALVHADLTITSVSAITGRSLAVAVHDNYRDISFTDNGDGSWTFTYAVTGLFSLIPGATSAGRLFATDHLYVGDLSTLTDDYDISFTISFSGVQPDACPQIIAALS